jgi:hypothetical protein
VADHSLIVAYRHDLLARLPAELAAEVCDGLADAQEQYLRRGLSADQAAIAAIDEFGDPGTVADAFRRSCPVWRLARVLLVTGPVVGGWWAAVLMADRAWDWPIPTVPRLLFGLLLATSIALLVTAARARRYQSVRRAGIAGSAGVAFLDASALGAAMWLAPGGRWLLVIAACISATRFLLVAATLRRYLAHPVS